MNFGFYWKIYQWSSILDYFEQLDLFFRRYLKKLELSNSFVTLGVYYVLLVIAYTFRVIFASISCMQTDRFSRLPFSF